MGENPMPINSKLHLWGRSVGSDPCLVSSRQSVTQRAEPEVAKSLRATKAVRSVLF